MKKNLMFALFSVLLMMVSNSASAMSCSSMPSTCMDDDEKGDSKDSMNSTDHSDDSIWMILSKIEHLLVKLEGYNKDDSSYWGDDDEYGKSEKSDDHEKRNKHKKERNNKYGKNHDKGDRWASNLHEDDDFEGFWKHDGYGFEGRHGDDDRYDDKEWMEHISHKPHHDDDIPAVPVPASVWLFGSGLIGLVSLARRKSRRV